MNLDHQDETRFVTEALQITQNLGRLFGKRTLSPRSKNNRKIASAVERLKNLTSDQKSRVITELLEQVQSILRESEAKAMPRSDLTVEKSLMGSLAGAKPKEVEFVIDASSTLIKKGKVPKGEELAESYPKTFLDIAANIEKAAEASSAAVVQTKTLSRKAKKVARNDMRERASLFALGTALSLGNVFGGHALGVPAAVATVSVYNGAVMATQAFRKGDITKERMFRKNVQEK